MREFTRHLLVAALLALAIFATATNAHAQLGDPDLTTMITLQETYGFGAAFGWPTGTNPCPFVGADWNGVVCDQGRVVDLDLICGATLLNEPIPPVLGNLTGLSILDLRNCGLTGSIPDAINNLNQLNRLRLNDNSLSGAIPGFLATFPALAILELTNNQLTGTIPSFPNTTGEVTRLGGNFLTEIPATWTKFNRVLSYNCYPSLPATCDSQSTTNACTPNRQDCPGAVTLAKVSGDGQRAQIGTSFANPLVVLVSDLSSNPVAGTLVTFSGPGIVTTTAISDVNGMASANVTADSTVGGNTVTASTGPTVMVAFGLTNGSAPTCSASVAVTSNGDSGPGTLRQALADVCPGGTVTLSGIAGGTVTLASRLYISTDVTIAGAGVTISGNGATRIFFVEGGNVTLQNLTLENGLGQGGTSQFGGAAAGMGGAIFQNGGNLTLNTVALSGNQALGGSQDTSGTATGGGFGANSTGGDLGGTAGTGDGAGGVTDAIGGIGGFGGGGGAGTSDTIGSGSIAYGGGGGFGGGGGWSTNTSAISVASGIAGYGGGQGSSGSGGGGAGFGGAIFARSGTLNLGGVTFTGNSAVGGSGAQGKGGALFIYNGAILNEAPNLTFTGSVAAAAGAAGQGYSAAPYQNGATCPGVDTVDICGTLPTNTLTVTISGNGSVADAANLINCPAVTCSALFQGTVVLTATPTPGNVFSNWSGGGCSGTGTCTVSLASGSVSVTANFIPGTAPLVTQNPSSVTVNAGTTATFMAAATGNPTPTVQWQVSTDGVHFSNAPGSSTSTTYSFTATQAMNGNQYRAVFTNTVTSANSTAATLYITPAVTNVTSTNANGSYGAGASVAITVAFTSPVTVTGTPQLALNSGGTAGYSKGNGTSTLTFTYSVAAPQSSAHLEYASTGALTLNGGSIANSVSYPALLTLPAPGATGSLSANTNIVIDTTPPTVTSYSVLFGSQSFVVGSVARTRLPWQITGIQVAFSKAVNASTASLTGVTATAVAGIGTSTVTWTISPLSVASASTAVKGTGASAVTDIAGNALGGGVDYAQALKVLWGDYNDDGVVSAADMVLVNGQVGQPYNRFADMNGDGTVNAADVTIVRQRVGTQLP
jgi:hypothetical protein